MVHYNFPGFSVGEAKPMFGVGRRELGHGNLAKKALEAAESKDSEKLFSVGADLYQACVACHNVYMKK